MGYFLFTAITVAWFVPFSFLIVKRTKGSIGNMEKMLISMIISMPSAFLLGILCSVFYKGNLMMSSFLAIGLSIIIAVIIGLNLGFIPLVEALFSGFMSGLMGAMLGEMVSVQTVTAALPFFLLWIIVALILLVILTGSLTKLIKFFLPPLLLMYFVLGYWAFYPDFIKEGPGENEPRHDGH